MGAIAAFAPAMAAAVVAATKLKKWQPVTGSKSAIDLEVLNEQAMDYASALARRKRGLGSTILTTDQLVPSGQVGKKTLLGG